MHIYAQKKKTNTNDIIAKSLENERRKRMFVLN